MALKLKSDFVVVNKLSAVCLRDAFPDSGAEAVLFFYQTQSRVLYQVLGVGPDVSGDTGELGFLLRCETHFHALNIKIAGTSVKRAAAGPRYN